MEKEFSPKTLLEAVTYFSDVEVATDFMVRLRWPDGVACPRCQGRNVVQLARVTRQQNRRIWNCRDCRRQFGVKVGTVMEDSPIGLDKWLPAFWLLAGAKNGISSCELSRALGITQKSAWFLLHRIRLVMKQGTFEKLSGTVEADETFIGGKEANKHASKKLNQGRGAVGKAVVVGLLEKGGNSKPSQVKAAVVKNTSRQTLHNQIRKNVAAGSELHTDAWRGYQGIAPEYVHLIVDHAIEYVKDSVVTTNGLENFWALLKRTLRGTYVSCDFQHLAAYLDEQAFRFNHRRNNDAGRFALVAGAVEGKRLTYRELTGR